MPVEVALHKGNSFALDGMRDDDRRPSGYLRGLIASREECRDVMAVALDHLPAEGLPLGARVLLRRAARQHTIALLGGPSILLEPVVVKYRGDIVELVACR